MSKPTDDQTPEKDVNPKRKVSSYYRKPTRGWQFKPGESGNPLGTRRRKRKADETEIEDILNEPLTVIHNGKSVKMSPFEVGIRNQVKSALNDGKLSDALSFIAMCEMHQALKAPESESSGGTVIIPVDWDKDEWLAMYMKYGSPPWPGKRHGMTYLMEQRLLQQKSEPKKRGRPPGSRKQDRVIDCAAIVKKVAFEIHKLPGRKKRRYTVIELILNMIRIAAAGNNSRALKTMKSLLERYSPKADRQTRGLLIMPEGGRTDEEIARRIAENQRKYRERP